MNVRLILALVIAVHGLGHLLGVMVVPLGMLRNNGFNESSWLLTDRLGISSSAVKGLGLLWLVATLGFALSAYGYFLDLAWWETAIKVSVALSVALFVVWWNAFPGSIPVQANLGNVAALVALYLNV